jgi:primary-amine oxidase
MMIMEDLTFSYKRGIFASKPIWVTEYRDDEPWAAGEFTNQNQKDTELGVWAMRNDNVENEDLVLWNSVGLTYIPRPEGNWGNLSYSCITLT